MSHSSEVIRIVQFVRDQRARVQSERQWKHRLAQFGFAINETSDGPAILTLPAKRMVCLLPADLRARGLPALNRGETSARQNDRMESVSFKLPEHIVARLSQIAREEDVSLGQVVRLAIERDLARRDGFARHPRTPELLLAPIRERVRAAFIEARGWGDLRARLIACGYSLRELGGGLALHDGITGRFLCRTSEIGFGYPSLMRQFGKPFPGHSQTTLLDTMRAVPRQTGA